MSSNCDCQNISQGFEIKGSRLEESSLDTPSSLDVSQYLVAQSHLLTNPSLSRAILKPFDWGGSFQPRANAARKTSIASGRNTLEASQIFSNIAEKDLGEIGTASIVEKDLAEIQYRFGIPENVELFCPRQF